MMHDMHSSQYLERVSSYSWRKHAQRVLRLTRGRCALIPFLPASECHHLHYRNLGSETMVVDTVPLSVLGHAIVHAGFFWKTPLHGLVNLWLRLTTLLLAVLLRPKLAIVAVLVVVAAWYTLAPRVEAAYASVVASVTWKR